MQQTAGQPLFCFYAFFSTLSFAAFVTNGSVLWIAADPRCAVDTGFEHWPRRLIVIQILWTCPRSQQNPHASSATL